MRSPETRTEFLSSTENIRYPKRLPRYLREHVEEKSGLVRISKTIFGQSYRVLEQVIDAPKKDRTLLLVSGFSGAGKDSLVWRMIEKDSRFGWAKTCTTRLPRPGESLKNSTYFHLTEEEFQEAVLNDSDVIEQNEFAGNKYCSLMSAFARGFEEHEIPILRPDPTGARFYLDLWRKNEKIFTDVNLIYLFLVTPTFEELRSRLVNRSDSPETIERRMAENLNQLHFVNDAEFIAVNPTNNLDQVVDDAISLFSSVK